MTSWSLLVTLHNLVNIPVSVLDNGPRTFVVEVHLQHHVSAYSAPAPTAVFSTNDIVSATPGLLEARLDEGANLRECAKVWRCSLPEMEAVVQVKEMLTGDSGFGSHRGDLPNPDDLRLVGSSTPLHLSGKDIVEVQKMSTFIIGTEMGQVGVSFSVDPEDVAGYRHRLETFLRKHNPQGLRLVPSVVDAVPEVDTFTKLFRKYNVRDYEKRLQRFFGVYGPQYTSEIPSLLAQWENREEELMRNLILDNGPEVDSVSQQARLTAYLTLHSLQRDQRDVKDILERYSGGESRSLFEALVSRFGREPDPRTYLFPQPRYEPLPTTSSPQRTGEKFGQTYRTPPRQPAKPLHPLRTAPSSPNSVHVSKGRASDTKYLSITMTPTPKSKAEQRPPTSAVTKESENTSGFYREALFKSTSVGDGVPISAVTPHQHVFVTGEAQRSGNAALWRNMCSMMQTKQRQGASWREYQLFYQSEGTFIESVRHLGVFDTEEQYQLLSEWHRRVRLAMREETLTSGDTYYAATVQETANLVHLQPLHLQVASATSMLNKEHYAGFSAYMEGAKEQRTERLVLVGEHHHLREIAHYGLYTSVETSPSSATALPGSHPIIFYREPFRQWAERRNCSLLICDVAVGRTHECPPNTHVPEAASREFLNRFDSSSFQDEAKGPAVAVYNPQQVLPRLLIQCTVDVTLLPCPSHPSKAVEYYVMESHAFACSRCVVMGEYKGREVTPIEEAAVLARSRLADIQRTTDALRESMLAYNTQLSNEEAKIPTAPRRVQAEQEVERLQREVEERIRSIRRCVQLEDEAQRSRIRRDLEEVQSTLGAVDHLVCSIQGAIHQSSSVDTVCALQRIQQERQVEQLITRVQERVPTAPLERVLPLEGVVSAPSPARRPVARSRHKAASGLNESHATSFNGGDSQILHSAVNSSTFDRGAHPPMESEPTDTDLYSKYLAIAGGKERMQKHGIEGTKPVLPSQAGRRVTPTTPSVSTASTQAPWSVGVGDRRSGPHQPPHNDPAKDALARGWALLRRGDITGAKQQWSSVWNAHGDADSMGTKARAYIAETIEKDYATAEHWYARSLQLDPHDRVTAYNYGVLLEALLERPKEAMALYERAAALGDTVAASRAEELRSALQLECNSSTE